MSQLQVQVFMNESAMQSNKRLFERIVTIDDSVVIDYGRVISVLRFLFGSQVIINFNIKSL